MKQLVAIILFLAASVSSMAQETFKEMFNEAAGMMKDKNYSEALSIWLKLEETNPENANIQFSIGHCYMNSRFEKEKSIPYFKKAENHLVESYSEGSYKETSAPLETILYLGKAYHINYNFEAALEKFFEYKEIVFKKNNEFIKRVDRDIEITKNAMRAMKAPVDVTVKQIDNINTEFAEYRPVVNADESMMIFTARRSDSKGGKKDYEGKYFEDVLVSYNDNGTWTKPTILGESINTNGHEATVYLAPSGDRLFLYKDLGDDQAGGIYETKLKGEDWTKPKLLKATVNSEAWETHASISVDGRMMAFTSDRDGGFGGRDIWIAKKLPNGNWGEPINAGPTVNTEYEEESPYLHPDGKTMYFSSQAHATIGGFDIYSVELYPEGTWSEPKNMGYPLNTTGDDVFFAPTTDGKRAYFSSYREGGKGDQDIYVMDLNFMEEKSLTIYKGLAHDINGNVVKNLVITVFDEETDDLFGIYTPNPVTGKFMFILRPGHTYEIEYEVNGVVQSEKITVADGGGTEEIGRLIVSEKDKISISAKDSKDIDILEMARIKEANNLEVIEVNVILNAAIEDSTIENQVKDSAKHQVEEDIKEVLNAGGNIVLSNVLFEFNSSQLTSEAKGIIDLIGNYLKNNKTTRIKISGHTDGIGPVDYNQNLSEKRTRSVRNYLVENGASKSQLEYKGYGESQPVAPNKIDGEDNPEGRAQNRRVEFGVVK